LNWFWHIGGQHFTARVHLDALLALAADAPPSRGRALARLAAGMVSTTTGEWERSLGEWAGGYEDGKAVADAEAAAEGIMGVGYCSLSLGRMEDSGAALDEAIARSAGGVCDFLQAISMTIKGMLRFVTGDPESGMALIVEARRIQERLNDREGGGMALSFLAQMSFAKGDHARALVLYDEALESLAASMPGDGMPKRDDGRPHLDAGGRLFIDILARRTAHDLAILLPGLRPDLVVYEQYELGAAVAAHAAGIPAVCHSLSPRPPDELIPMYAGDRLDRLWAEHGMSAFSLDVLTGDAFVDIFPNVLQQPSFLDHPARLRLRPIPFTEPGVTVPTWVGRSGRPLVYLTLGTVVATDEVLVPAIHGLATLDADVLVALGSADGATLGELPPNVRSRRSSIKRPSCGGPTWPCTTAAVAPCSAPWPAAHHNCCCRRAPTSSRTPTPSRRPAWPRSSSRPTRPRHRWRPRPRRRSGVSARPRRSCATSCWRCPARATCSSSWSPASRTTRTRQPPEARRWPVSRTASGWHAWRTRRPAR